MHRRLLAVACLVLAGCTTSAPSPPTPPQSVNAKLGAWGVDIAGMDRSIRPGNDFFAYVNGNWEKQAVIPPDRSSIGTGQNLAILSEKRMKEIVADLEAKPIGQLTFEERKLRDLYDGYMDEKAIEARGLEPAKADLDRIAALKNHDQVARLMGSPTVTAGSLYAFGIGIDDKNSNAYSVNVSAAGLGLPDRDYYLLDEPDIAKTRQAYKAFIAAMLELSGTKDASARAEKVLALETAIAKARWELKDQRDADKMYVPMSFSALKKAAPQFPWDSFVAESGIPLKNGERQIIVGESTAIPVLAKIFVKTPVAVWRDYLTVQYLHNFAPYLPKKFDDTNFAFYGTVLGGRAQQSDRQTRAVRLLDTHMGEAFGKLYVAKHFPPEAKAKVQTLVSNILKAYEEDIRSLDWMGDETKKKALEKIGKFTPYLGYPDKWRDYSAYEVVRDDVVGNIKRSARFNWERNVGRLDSPVDKTEWQMTPPTVDAYYMSAFNSITFPAAILQSPIFDPDADDAVNYGAIGAVIGHEISHGFDDQGSKYNGEGVLQDWWTENDRKNFTARTQMLVKQYDAYEPLPGLHIRGDATLGENIADLAGLSISLKAYRISLDGKPAPVLDGFSGDQRVFLGYGQVWRSKLRDNDLRRRILSDVHSPAPFRVLGVIRNMDDWYQAFDVKPGDRYYLPPEERVKLW